MSDEAHSGPIKTPKQLLIAVLFSFLIPVFVIIALVAYVVADNKPAGRNDVASYSLGGMTAQDLERGVNERIRRVGTVEIRDANRPLKAGQEVYAAQCAACHATGAANAPKFGDAASWANRIQTGFEALVQSSLKGKGAMPPQAGGDFEETEVARAVAYMANSAGARFAEPAAPAPATAAAAASAPVPTAAAVPSAPAAAPVPIPVAAAAPAAAAAPVVVAAAAAPAKAAGAVPALYTQACQVCHVTGVANAPKLGDKAAWAPRLAQGMPALVQNVMKGKGAMPPKGGSTASEPEIKAVVEYMVGTVK